MKECAQAALSLVKARATTPGTAGTETIELDASNAPAPEIRDMIQLDDQTGSDPPAFGGDPR